MKVVGRNLLDAFCRKHTNARSWVEAWLAEAEEAVWLKPQVIKDRYAAASFLPGNTVIFNVKGNEYRMEVTVAYQSSIVVIRWVGTHREYDERNRNR
jgi:mRNA interferase HigB